MKLVINGIEIPNPQDGLIAVLTVDAGGESMKPWRLDVVGGPCRVECDTAASITTNGIDGGQLIIGYPGPPLGGYLLGSAEPDYEVTT